MSQAPRGARRQSRRSRPPRKQQEPGRTTTLQLHPWRLTVIGIIVAAVAAALGFRLALYQVVDQHRLVALAMSERSTAGSIPPSRGLIYDDVGNPLAINDEVYDVYASPNQITQPVAEARALAPLLNTAATRILGLLQSRLVYPRLAKGISQNAADKIQHLGLLGISLQPSPNRVYPEGSLASQVLGFVDANGGQYGLEQQYNRILSGKASIGAVRRLVRAEGDVWRGTVAGSQPQGLQAGGTLHLSLDTYMQDVAEQDVRRFVRYHQAASGTVIISNPRTGRIVAMANYPWFNPNRFAASPARNWTNPAIFDTYEPGSTFKIVTMAAGLNEHVITPKTTIFDPGYAVYPCITVQNWNVGTSNGRETMTQVLQHSANVGAAYVANLLGARRFYPYVRAFGVGAPTGIDLAGEASGSVPLPGVPGSNWTCPNLYTNAYGQSVTVTPLQLLNAANAVANGGWLMRPEVVTRIDYAGTTVYRPPHRIRRVISWASARTLTRMLVQSALGPPGQYGEASCALVPGYQVAAKTGTANLVSPKGRQGYLLGPGSTIASTVGFAPAFRPRFSVLAVIRQPRYPWPDGQWGSEVAAPLVHDLLQSLFLRYHIPPAGPPGRVLESQKAFGGCTF